jgi:hypothetical protein
MSERETVAELPWAADSCPCEEKLRTVLPLPVGIRDGVVHSVSPFLASSYQREQVALGAVKVLEMGTVLHFRTIDQTTEPRSQTHLI